MAIRTYCDRCGKEGQVTKARVRLDGETVFRDGRPADLEADLCYGCIDWLKANWPSVAELKGKPEANMINKLDLKPGDVLVMRLTQRLTYQAKIEFLRSMQDAFTRAGIPLIPVLVVEPGADISVLSTRQDEAVKGGEQA